MAFSSTNQKTKTTSKTKNKNTSITNSNSTQTSSQNTTQQTNSSTTGGSTSRTYTDTSGFSEQTRNAQNWLNNNMEFKPSENLNNALSSKQSAESALKGYGPYNSQYGDAIQKTLDDILNRKKFSYDFNEDSLYQNYKDQYALMGKQAAANAAASNAALTGGYGSSYGTSAAAQANQQYMSQLNEVIPELYKLALDRYNAEGNDLYNKYNLLNTEDEKGYGRYRDTRNDLVSDRDYYNSDYYNLRNAEENTFNDTWNRNYNMFNTLADLEKQTVTDENNWSNTSETSTSSTTSKSKQKDYQKAVERAVQEATEDSVTNSSTASTGSGGSSGGGGKGSGSSGSKKKDTKNTRTGTTTPQKVVDEAAAEVENILKLPSTSYVPDEYKNKGSHAFYAYALDKLTEYLNSGKINNTDYERIANQAGLADYR